MSYECLGTNPSTGNQQYRITMVVYRDFVNGQAPYDNPAMIGIYRGSNLYTSLALNNPNISAIPIDLGNPCLMVPPNVGVQEGVYTRTIELPFSPLGYTISYQRCCRNNTVSNVFNSGQYGSTYTIELTPAAQQQCNNSPTFNDFPPIVICLDEPLSFDHSATDLDGHTLRYSLCSPFEGGGPMNGSGFGGATPNPPAPPPYFPIPFAPGFSASNPLVGAPGLSIDSNTGLLTGTPSIPGQFIVGICVEEYDASGNLLSTTLRDFQFNVARCDNRVTASIQADSIDYITNRYTFIACEDTVITFDNTSGLPNFITSYEWRIDLGNGNIFTSSDFEPTLAVPADGVYRGWLVANPGSAGCTDTALLKIVVSRGLKADFSLSYDPCSLDPVQFNNQSVLNPNSPVQSYRWNFDGGVSTQENPSFAYTFPNTGIKDVSLRVVDQNGCVSTAKQSFDWSPLPIFPIGFPDSSACLPVVATNYISTYYPAPGYDFIWDFGDGVVQTNPSEPYVYTVPGTYNRKLTIKSQKGCSANFSSVYQVLEVPTAAFDYQPKDINPRDPTVTFIDQSQDVGFWDWDFGNGNTQLTSFGTVRYTYPDTGKYKVRLTVTHANGCQDSSTLIVDVPPDFSFFLPNALTPNEDGLNDLYKGKGFIRYLDDFSMTIYNRWGQQVFQTTNPNEGWNGRWQNTGKKCQAGVYVVQVELSNARGKRERIVGKATIVY